MEMHITVITIIIQFIMSTRQNAPYSFASTSSSALAGRPVITNSPS